MKKLFLVIVLLLISNTAFALLSTKVIIDDNISYTEYSTKDKSINLRFYEFAIRKPSELILQTHKDRFSGETIYGLSDVNEIKFVELTEDGLWVLLDKFENWDKMGPLLNNIIKYRILIDELSSDDFSLENFDKFSIPDK